MHRCIPSRGGTDGADNSGLLQYPHLPRGAVCAHEYGSRTQ